MFVSPERSPLERLHSVHVRFPLDLERMREGARHLTGTHDFTSFASNLNQTQALRRAEGKRDLETVRTVRRIDFKISGRDPRCIVMEIEGSGFLYQMVRTIAGSLIDVGRGFKPPEWIAAARDARDRRQAGPAAPPHGLCLERVFY
jgi:tRNA pseudouridine38-40 synthase